MISPTQSKAVKLRGRECTVVASGNEMAWGNGVARDRAGNGAKGTEFQLQERDP